MKFQSVVLASAFSMVLAVPAISQGAADAQQGGSNQGTTQSGNSSQAGNSSPQSTNQANGNSSDSNQVAQASSKDEQKAIKKVQRKLKRRGYLRGKVDGVWGQDSVAALKKYQQEKDIQASGTMDKQTADKLGLSQSEFSKFEAAVGQQSGSRGSQSSQGSQESQGSRSSPSDQNSGGSSDQPGTSGSDSTQ